MPASAPSAPSRARPLGARALEKKNPLAFANGHTRPNATAPMPSVAESQSRWVYRSAVASLGAQLLIFAVTSAGLFVDVGKDARTDLMPIFALELASQLIEMVWYLVVVCRYRVILTWTRYLDWVVSTPVMLVSTALFFYHRRGRPIADVFESPFLYLSLAFNWIMLLFGYLSERGAMRTTPAVAFGTLALVASFAALAALSDRGDALSTSLFWTIFGVWLLYGVAAALADVPKNIMYNGLDIVSKNVYGVFLFGYTLSIA